MGRFGCVKPWACVTFQSTWQKELKEEGVCVGAQVQGIAHHSGSHAGRRMRQLVSCAHSQEVERDESLCSLSFSFS